MNSSGVFEEMESRTCEADYGSDQLDSGETRTVYRQTYDAL